MRKRTIIVCDRYDLLKAARADLEDEGSISTGSLKPDAEREQERRRREASPLWTQLPLPLGSGTESSPGRTGKDETA
jgi:hypothetical protein